MDNGRISEVLCGIIVEPYEENASDRHPDCPPTGCWGHAAKPNDKGYRKVSISGKIVRLHRFVYEHLRGAIPEGLEPDHLCRNRGCCNPDHIACVTHQENTLRSQSAAGVNAGKTHCPKGHPYSGENVRVNGSGGRYCLACRRERNRACYQKRKDKVREYTRKWREQHPGYTAEMARRYRARKRQAGA